MIHLTDPQRKYARELLASLVAIDSVNENNEQGDRDQSERRMSEFVCAWLEDLGMEVRRFEMAPGRDNLVAHWPSQTASTSLAFQSHMDTVSVNSMTIDPFGAEVRDGRLWGRGSCDTKGSMAAFLTAMKIAHEAGFQPVDKMYFVATAAEETGCRGASSLVDAGFRVDAMVVGEPTGSQVVTAHKGTHWATLEATGRSCHGSLPHLGHNAVYTMAKAISFIEKEYVPGLDANAHALLGGMTLSVGTIRGGVATNIVPAECVANLDFRILPGQDPADVHAEFLDLLRTAVPDEEFTLTTIHTQPGVETPRDTPLVENLLAVCDPLTGQTDPVGVNYFTDCGPFHAAGISCVVFGPGDIAQAHTAAEYVELDQLFLATEVALGWLQAGTRRSFVR